MGPPIRPNFPIFPPLSLSSSCTGTSGAAAHGGARAGTGAGAGSRPQSLAAARMTVHAARGGRLAGVGDGWLKTSGEASSGGVRLRSMVSPPRAVDEEEEPTVAAVAHRIRTKQIIF